MRIGLWGIIAALVCLPATSRSSDCTAAYQAAGDRYSSFVQSVKQKQSLERWEDLARQFAAVAEKFPACHKADDALFTAGKLRFESYQFLKQPDQLRAAAEAFLTLIQKYPASFLADDAQFYRGRCYELLGDPAQARIEYQLTIKNFHRGDMVREARDRLARLPKTPATPAPQPTVGALHAVPLPAAPAPATPTVAAAATAPAPVGARVTPPALPPPAQILSIRYWSSKDYTRVVLDFDREVTYAPPHLLQPDPALGSPPRLYLDFPGTVLSQEFKQKTPLISGFYDLPIGDGLLQKARAGQPQATASRVVLDLESITSYHCFPLPGEEGGYRVVIDINGQKKAAPPPMIGESPRPPGPPLPEPAAPTPAKETTTVKPSPAEPAPAPATPSPSPAQPPSSGPRVPPPARAHPKPSAQKYLIVIDAGHGGKDPGAIGPGRMREKDVTLAVAKKLKKRLERENPNLEVVLTRSDDTYLSLVERTAKANILNANLFISIHCNASPNRQVAGIETYYLDNTTDRAALKLAARENFVTEEKMTQTGDLNYILADMATSSKVEDSVPLAGLIQESLVRELKKEYGGVNNLGVKKAPFWVLTGARMPCVLIETSFISNRKEEKRLASFAYQDDLAHAVALGVRSYLREHPSQLASSWGE